MSGENGFTSIADVLAAATKKSKEDAEKLKSRILSSGGKKAAPPARPASSAVGFTGGGELLDDFDYAIQAVQMVRKSLPPDSIGAEKAAVTILVAKRRLSIPDATDLVKHAIRYLDD